jgi:hypothetical protein
MGGNSADPMEAEYLLRITRRELDAGLAELSRRGVRSPDDQADPDALSSLFTKFVRARQGGPEENGNGV